MEIHLNAAGGFYYLMKLHYSQTTTLSCSHNASFYYLMKLHYPQTFALLILSSIGFTTL